MAPATGGGFGAPSVSNGFGTNAQPHQTGGFGATAQPGGFGATAQPGGFGAASSTAGGAFGAQPAGGRGGFGAPANGAPAAGVGFTAPAGFPQKNETPSFGANASAGGFGGTAQLATKPAVAPPVVSDTVDSSLLTEEDKAAFLAAEFEYGYEWVGAGCEVFFLFAGRENDITPTLEVLAELWTNHGWSTNALARVVTKYGNWEGGPAELSDVVFFETERDACVQLSELCPGLDPLDIAFEMLAWTRKKAEAEYAERYY